MPGFFYNPPWQPSDSSRKFERGSLFVEGGVTVVSSMIENGINSPYAGMFKIIPQIVLSITAATRADTHLSERILHATQSLLGLAQLATFIYMIYDDDNCVIIASNLCKTAQILKVTYVSLLAAGGAGSEILYQMPRMTRSIAPDDLQNRREPDHSAHIVNIPEHQDETPRATSS
tara:strand:+ start:305 stop:829 length:525 start_codon:yes stop_codon:yes gene_type:complete